MAPFGDIMVVIETNIGALAAYRGNVDPVERMRIEMALSSNDRLAVLRSGRRCDYPVIGRDALTREHRYRMMSADTAPQSGKRTAASALEDAANG